MSTNETSPVGAGIPVESRIPASERACQKLSELLTQRVAEGDARSELIKLAVQKIVERPTDGAA